MAVDLSGLLHDISDAFQVRELLREDHLARRVKMEREARDWSQETLARKMKTAGFPLPQSSISRIESSTADSPHRSISVDEAIGLSIVFEKPLLELLQPIGRYGTQAVRDLVDGAALVADADLAQSKLDGAVRRVAHEFVDHPDDFGPVLAGEARRLCEAADINYSAGVERALLAALPEALEPPLRHQLVFLQLVVKAKRKLLADARRREKGKG